MASTQMKKDDNTLDLEAHERPAYRRLGILNGFLIGLALALGAWAAEAVALAQLPLPVQHPSLALGSFLLILVCTLAGWLTSRWVKFVLTLLAWLLAAVMATLIIAYQPSFGRNLVAWLGDSRFFGLPIFPNLDAPIWSIFVAGFAIFLALSLLAFVQAYRLEGAQRELGTGGRMSGRSLFMLLWPMIFVAVAGYVTNNITGDKSARDALLVQEAIDTGRTYEGDLFQLGLERGVNYSAIKGVRDQMSPNYSLLIGGVDDDTITTFIVVDFDNGAWITCRIINGQLNYCYDAAPPYTTGLASLISGEPVPEDCLGCMPRVEEETADWLRRQGDLLGDDPQIERLAQKGGYVLVGVTSKTGDHALECWFNGMSPVTLEQCEIVNP